MAMNIRCANYQRRSYLKPLHNVLLFVGPRWLTLSFQKDRARGYVSVLQGGFSQLRKLHILAPRLATDDLQHPSFR